MTTPPDVVPFGTHDPAVAMAAVCDQQDGDKTACGKPTADSLVATPSAPAQAGEALVSLANRLWNEFYDRKVDPKNTLRELIAGIRALAAMLAATPTVPVASGGEVERLREAWGEPADWAEKLEELYGWTGSAWVSGEQYAKRSAGLHAFLCSLIGYLVTGEEAARATLTPTAAPGSEA